MIKHVSNKIQNAIQLELFKAKESIKIAVAWFTNELLLQPLILKLQNGVSVEIILNDDEINRGGESSLDFIEFLQAGGVLRWNDSKQLMHDKFCIIDNKIVITGSYNWTNKAEYNSEVENFFYDEEETTEFYNELYGKLSERFEKETCVVINKEEIPENKSYYDEEGFYIDEQGAKYSNDRKRLIKVPGDELRTHYINEKPILIISGKCPTSYHFPDSVTTIEDYAFSVCTCLKSIHIPNSVISIGKGAFSNCSALTSIHIPDSVTNIGDGAFESSSIESVRLPNSLRSIGTDAFHNCSSLTSIHIPNDVKIIGNGAFSRCKYLVSINLPDSVTTIGDYAFYGCSSLSTINIPNGVKSIGKNAFGDCRNLKSLIIPNGLTSIGEQAFWFTDLRSINIPDSITNIGKGAFGNTLIDTFYIPVGSNVRERLMSGWNMWNKKVVEYNAIEDLFKEVTNSDLENAWIDEFGVKYSIDRKRLLKAPSHLVNYSIRNGTIIICNHAFDDCSILKELHIPDSLTYIGDWSFARCHHLTTINIPYNVKNIGALCFFMCNSIKIIEIPNSLKRIGKRVFYGCDILTDIHIPFGSKSKFEELLPEYKEKLVEL